MQKIITIISLLLLTACSPNFSTASSTVTDLIRICEERSFNTTRTESEGTITVTVSCQKYK
jgi:hypothetical protein